MKRLQYHLALDVIDRQQEYEKELTEVDNLPVASGLEMEIKIYRSRIATLFKYPATIFTRLFPPYRYEK